MMKKSILFYVVFVLFLGLVSSAYASDKIAFVELGTLFDKYEKTKDADEKLSELAQQKQKEREEKVQHVRRLKDEMVVLSDEGDEKRKKQEEIDQSIKELQTFDEVTRNELRQIRDDNVKVIFEDLNNAITTYGEKKGYDFILSDRSLVYKDEKHNITNIILKDLNKEYK